MKRINYTFRATGVSVFALACFLISPVHADTWSSVGRSSSWTNVARWSGTTAPWDNGTSGIGSDHTASDGMTIDTVEIFSAGPNVGDPFTARRLFISGGTVTLAAGGRVDVGEINGNNGSGFFTMTGGLLQRNSAVAGFSGFSINNTAGITISGGVVDLIDAGGILQGFNGMPPPVGLVLFMSEEVARPSIWRE